MNCKTYFNWSSGKDSALALHYLLSNTGQSVDLLLTTVNAHYDRVSMHGLRREVLESQAEAIGIKLDVLEVPEKPTMEEYNALMTEKMRSLRFLGYEQTVFGDIFLEDLRKYREEMLSQYEVKALFPLWKRDTQELILEFIDLGFRAVIVCINGSKLDDSFLGQELSKELIKSFPADVDPCGENGEYHTFCFDGPIFIKPLDITIGEKVFRTYENPTEAEEDLRFGFCDVTINNTLPSSKS